jgi:hypothetical protein
VQARIIAAERGIQLEGEEAIDPDRLLPGGLRSLALRDWTLSPGVRLRANSSSSSSSEASGSSSSSSDGNLKYYVTLRKQPQVGAAVLGAAFPSSKHTRCEHSHMPHCACFFCGYLGGAESYWLATHDSAERTQLPGVGGSASPITHATHPIPGGAQHPDQKQQRS